MNVRNEKFVHNFDAKTHFKCSGIQRRTIFKEKGVLKEQLCRVKPKSDDWLL
jgi:hypothetical protein